MVDELKRVVAEIGALQSKLVLLVGESLPAKASLLSKLGQEEGLEPLRLGLALAKRLSMIPQKQRHLRTWEILRELADQNAKGDLLLVGSIELLFDRNLQLDPLDLLKRHAHARRVVAVWPGDFRGGRLTYAQLGHPEHRNYGIEGVKTFPVQ